MSFFLRSLPIKLEDGLKKSQDFMKNAKKILDECVYGLDDAKMQIMQMIGGWISNPNAVGTAIAIQGPMGTGKTTLVKEGISKILNRPFSFIPLGGATDSSYLEGHSYTYEGSMWGKIVDILLNCKCMNPVIYFDELDKACSKRGSGTNEIMSILIHLTDPNMNTCKCFLVIFFPIAFADTSLSRMARIIRPHGDFNAVSDNHKSINNVDKNKQA